MLIQVAKYLAALQDIIVIIYVLSVLYRVYMFCYRRICPYPVPFHPLYQLTLCNSIFFSRLRVALIQIDLLDLL